MDSEKAILHRIGLSEGEIKVYLALLDTGHCTTNTLHENTGIERRNIYDILNKLIGKGLVTYSNENNTRTFQTAHPQVLKGYLEEKKKIIDVIQEDLIQVIPNLVAKFEETKPKIQSEIFRGPQGMKAVWNDMLNEKTSYWIGSGNYVPDKFPAFYQDWTKRRIKCKHKALHLARSEKFKDIIVHEGMSTKELPKEFSGQPAVIVAYGNKVANLLLGDEIFAFIIESKDLAENYKAYHKYLWDKVATK